LKAKLKVMLFVALVATLVGVGAASIYVQAAGEAVEAAKSSKPELMWIALSAMLAIAAPGVAAAIGLSMATSSIAAAGAERPEIIGRFFIFVVFIEAIAIYGLIVAIFIILMLPTYL